MEEKQIEQREGIKLVRNAKGNYQWELKVLGEPLVSLDTIKNLEDLDKELKAKFGEKNE